MNKEQMAQIDNNAQDRLNLANNYIKWKWTKFTHKKSRDLFQRERRGGMGAVGGGEGEVRAASQYSDLSNAPQ